MRRVRAHVLKRFELYVAGMALAFMAAAIALIRSDAPAGVAVLATVLGMTPIWASIQWADRERQRQLRARAIAEIREMLTDRVLNQLAAARMWMAEDPDPETLATILAETDAAIDQVSDMITGLSEEQLHTWRLTYANVADHIAFSSVPDYAPA